ncbi:hypothetical protein SNEBB_008600 [Seison nebaliae]|nr:hypothetical protein SNEBB_008600 [Seison nebaliae]
MPLDQSDINLINQLTIDISEHNRFVNLIINIDEKRKKNVNLFKVKDLLIISRIFEKQFDLKLISFENSHSNEEEDSTRKLKEVRWKLFEDFEKKYIDLLQYCPKEHEDFLDLLKSFIRLNGFIDNRLIINFMKKYLFDLNKKKNGDDTKEKHENFLNFINGSCDDQKIRIGVMKFILNGPLSTFQIESSSNGGNSDLIIMKNSLILLLMKMYVFLAKQIEKDEKLEKDLYSQIWIKWMRSEKLDMEHWKYFLKYLSSIILPVLQRLLTFLDILEQFINNMIETVEEPSDISISLGLLALHSMFIISQRNGLEMKNFYESLYQLLNEKLLKSFYSPQLFTLLSLYLSSTQLPKQTSISFAKKLGRLALTSSNNHQTTIHLLILLIFYRNKHCRLLVNDNGESMKEDPFDELSHQLLMTNADKSSLWEMEITSFHFNRKISQLATDILTESKTDQVIHRYQQQLIRSIDSNSLEMFFCESNRISSKRSATDSTAMNDLNTKTLRLFQEDDDDGELNENSFDEFNYCFS